MDLLELMLDGPTRVNVHLCTCMHLYAPVCTVMHRYALICTLSVHACTCAYVHRERLVPDESVGTHDSQWSGTDVAGVPVHIGAYRCI